MGVIVGICVRALGLESNGPSRVTRIANTSHCKTTYLCTSNTCSREIQGWSSNPMTEDSHRTAGAYYAAAGVDSAAGDRAVEIFAPLAQKEGRLKVSRGCRGFPGLFSHKGEKTGPRD